MRHLSLPGSWPACWCEQQTLSGGTCGAIDVLRVHAMYSVRFQHCPRLLAYCSSSGCYAAYMRWRLEARSWAPLCLVLV
jgi:hypothetical protein